MKLFTKEILSNFEKQGDTSEMEMKDTKVICKLFDCAGSSKWYLTEYDPDEEMGFGFCMLNGDYQFAELGRVYIPELKEALGWRLERDRHFGNHTLEEDFNTVKAGKHI